MNLDHLLDERARLRFLISERTKFRVTTQLDKLAGVEIQIAQLVLEGLALAKKDTPTAWMVCAAVDNFAWFSTDPRYIERPELVFATCDCALVPSVTTAGWHPDVKTRIAELAGSLDGIILKQRQTETAAA